MTTASALRSTIDVPALLAALPARISDIPALAAARDPQHIALIEDARRLTNAQLMEAVDAAAALLREWGVRGGDRVMIVAENSIAQIVLLFATARLDAWALVSNARLSAAELDAIRAHAKPRVTAYMVESSVDASQHAERHQAREAPRMTRRTSARGPTWWTTRRKRKRNRLKQRANANARR